MLQSKSIEEVLKSYEFPHRFCVKYALNAARLANNKIKRPDPAVVKCLDLVQLWLDSNGNSTVVTDSELRNAADAVGNAAYAVYAADAAKAVAHAAADAARAAAYAIDATARIDVNAISAVYAAYAVCWAEHSGVKTKVLKSLLLDTIHIEFTELECVLLGLT